MRLIYVSKQFKRQEIDLQACDPEELIMMIDVDRCISCGACELACQAEHRDSVGDPGLFRPISFSTESGKEDKYTVYLPLACRHCESPCEYYTPYNFWITCPRDSEKRRNLVSCDLCAERTGKGMWPACATRCSMKTIYFGIAHDIAFALGEKRLREMGDAEIQS